MIECTLYKADGSYRTALEVPSLQDVILNMDSTDHLEIGLFPRNTEYRNGEIIFIKPPIEQVMRSLRATRDIMLRRSDWVLAPDVTMSVEKKQAWLDYRQALRDAPTTLDPRNPVWPEQPK